MADFCFWIGCWDGVFWGKPLIMRYFSIFLLTLIGNWPVFSQGCLPDGIVFTSQGQIDSFGLNYPGCVEVLGDVTIEGSGSQITNTIGLSQLEKVSGDLTIDNCDSLTTLQGLEGLTLVEEKLTIYQNSNLLHLDALSSLTTVKDIRCYDNDMLENIDGLQNVDGDFIQKAYIVNNDSLTICTGYHWLCKLNSKNFDDNLRLNNNGPGCSDLVDIVDYCYQSDAIYVKVGGTGDGSTWANATGSIQAAIDSAANSGSTIWIAEGTYKPTNCTSCTFEDRSISFEVVGKHLTFLGGFPAVGSPSLSERDWENHPTIWSGDIGEINEMDDNSFSIIKLDEVIEYFYIVTKFDGISFQDGNANDDSSEPHKNGGAIVQNDGLVVSRNCIFQNNYALEKGGALWDGEQGRCLFENCRFTNNTTQVSGGALYFWYRGDFINCRFEGNSSDQGGGIEVRSGGQVFLTGCVFVDNQASGSGGALYTYNLATTSHITNCTFVRNTAPLGSAIRVTGDYSSSVSIRNSIFYGNVGKDICASDGVHLSQVISDKSSKDAFIYATSLGNLTELYLNITDPFTDFTNGDFSLAPMSPAINSGRDHWLPDDLLIDIAGNNRFVNCVDLGAYEFQGPDTCIPDPSNIIYVNQLATGNNDGTTWADAYTDFQAALDQLAICPVDSVWIAAGTYYPAGCYTCDTNNPREFSFELRISGNCVFDTITPVFYGGFPNSGSPTINDRDWNSHPTILSGNIGDTAIHTDNSFAVFRSINHLVLDGITIQDGYADGATDPFNAGAAINVYQGVELWNCILTNNHSISNGGAVYCYQSGAGSFTNCNLSNNTTQGSGGVIYVDNLSVTTFNNTNAWDNHALVNGGVHSGRMKIWGLSISGGTCFIQDCIFTGNTAQEHGGVFYGNEFTISNSQFSENSSVERGGAIRCRSFEATNCVFENNEAMQGGAVYSLPYQPAITVTSTQFLNNSAESGGAIFIQGWRLGDIEVNSVFATKAFIDRCQFRSNTADDEGGAIWFNNLKHGQIFNSLFENNSASSLGGALYGLFNEDFSTGNAAIHNNTFSGNTAAAGSVFSSAEDVNPRFNNNIIWGNSGSGNQIVGEVEMSNCLTDLTDCAQIGPEVTCIADIYFSSANPFLDVSNNDYTLHDSSYAINNGSNDFVDSTYLYDLSGNERILLNTVDIGAYEYTGEDVDLDQDGFPSIEDCDDLNANVNPDQNEIPYNGWDDDCDPTTLDDDLDQDGFLLADDCDDNDPTINPDAIEIVNNAVDENCDGYAAQDADLDGFLDDVDCDDDNPDINPDATEIINNAIDENCDGYAAQDADLDGFLDDVDCNDADANINPGVPEIPYNGVDDDCNENTPDDDLDGDGFGIDDDCDDDNADINPGVQENPYNGINDDCNDNTPDDDLDGDGFPLADDCDDQNPTINPNAEDIPNNGIDEDCDGEDATISAKETVSLRPQVFPNPTSSKITVIFPVLAQATATLKTTTGKTILQHSFRQQTTLDLTELTSGVYVLLVNTEEGQWMERVVVLF